MAVTMAGAAMAATVADAASAATTAAAVSAAARGGRSGGRGGNRSGSRGSYVPAREFADAPRDPEARPQAPAPVERIHDGDDFAMFGKIEL